MATTAIAYGSTPKLLLNLLSTGTIKAALLTAAYTPDPDNHTTFADVVGNELTGTGYTAGGNTLTGFTITYDAATNTAKMAAAATSWTALTGTFHYAAAYLSSGSNDTSSLLGVIDFGADRTYTAEPFELSFPSGLVTIQAV